METKKLSIEKMHQIQGGDEPAGFLDYCSLLNYWLDGGPGYQGDYVWLSEVYETYCR